MGTFGNSVYRLMNSNQVSMGFILYRQYKLFSNKTAVSIVHVPDQVRPKQMSLISLHSE